MNGLSARTILAAPLQGYTERFFRRAHALTIGGIEEYYTPFARLEHGDFRKRDLQDLQPDPDLPAVTVPQILVKTPAETRQLGDLICQRGFTRLDLNAGCPFPKVTAAGYGAALLQTPKALAEVLETAASFTELRLSVKLRLPTPCTPQALADLAAMFNDLPLCHVVLHPRILARQEADAPDSVAFKIFRNCLHHKLFYNGDITSTANDLPLETIMLGRGLLQNPLLPLELQGQDITQDRCLELLRNFHKALLENLQDTVQQPLPKLKTLWDYLLPETSKSLRKKIIKAVTLEDYLTSVERLLQAMATS